MTWSTPPSPAHPPGGWGAASRSCTRALAEVIEEPLDHACERGDVTVCPSDEALPEALTGSLNLALEETPSWCGEGELAPAPTGLFAFAADQTSPFKFV